MSTWEYRVIHTASDVYEIREVFYEFGESHGSCGTPPYGTSLDDLRADLGHQLAALDKPVIEEGDL